MPPSQPSNDAAVILSEARPIRELFEEAMNEDAAMKSAQRTPLESYREFHEIDPMEEVPFNRGK